MAFADIAMYDAKEHGGGLIKVYSRSEFPAGGEAAPSDEPAPGRPQLGPRVGRGVIARPRARIPATHPPARPPARAGANPAPAPPSRGGRRRRRR